MINETEATQALENTDEATPELMPAEQEWLVRRMRKLNRNPIVGITCDGKANNRRARRQAKHKGRAVPADYAPNDRILTYKPR